MPTPIETRGCANIEAPANIAIPIPIHFVFIRLPSFLPPCFNAPPWPIAKCFELCEKRRMGGGGRWWCTGSAVVLGRLRGDCRLGEGPPERAAECPSCDRRDS